MEIFKKKSGKRNHVLPGTAINSLLRLFWNFSFVVFSRLFFLTKQIKFENMVLCSDQYLGEKKSFAKKIYFFGKTRFFELIWLQLRHENNTFFPWLFPVSTKNIYITIFSYWQTHGLARPCLAKLPTNFCKNLRNLCKTLCQSLIFLKNKLVFDIYFYH